MRAAVFLDRDGTINEERGYFSSIGDFRLFPFVPHAIRRLNATGLMVVVVTNQAAIARGIVTTQFVDEVHCRLRREIAAVGGKIDGVYYCPHHPEGIVPEFSKSCDCRKPAIGMLLQAATDLGVNLKESYLVGDKVSDMEAAARAGARPVLVLTGYGEEAHRRMTELDMRPAFVAADLGEAAGWIERDFGSLRQAGPYTGTNGGEC